MKVRDVMETIVVSVSPKTTYEHAAKVMQEHHYSGLPVLDESGKLVGMLSEKDLFRALYPNYAEYARHPDEFSNAEQAESRIEDIRKDTVDLFMSKPVLSIEPEASVMKAGGIMLARGMHRLPVVENARMIGIVTRQDIYGAVLRHHLAF